MQLLTLMAVLAGALGLTALARRYNLSAPLLVVVVALAVSFIPGVPRIELEPELILTLVLPPLLYSTALESSFAQFRAASRPIIALGVVLVVVTAFVVGFVVHLLLPALPLASALVLGAVVAPPDAVTAVAIGRRLGLPRRLMTVLTGESLVNDAAALTLYKITLAAVLGTAGSIGHGFLIFLVAAVLGIAVGLAAGVIIGFVRRKLDDPLMESVFGIIVPFAVYVVAEHLHPFSADFSGSGVLAVVAAGLYLGNQSLHAGSATRVQDSSIWASLDVLLETLVFALMGLQLPFVLENTDAAAASNLTLAVAAVVVLLVTIGVRIPYVFLTGVLPHAMRLFGGERTRPPFRYFAILSWTGMRGVVTLAAATGVPLVTHTGAPFPGREEIQLFAFVVAIGTLLIQGLTLPVLIRRLGVDPEVEAERDEEQEKYAREQAMHAALDRLDELMPEMLSKLDIPKERADRLIARLRGLVESRYQAAVAAISLTNEEREESPHAAFVRARRELLLAQREAVLECREAGDLDDDVLRKVLRELDLEELSLSATLTSRLS
ncbi:CPA1 family monovalent cation:H+ antiporter [Amycolatopsis bartoniae]|uniref:Cation:proton antiporter n=1 Tax=Amycolatopsis bartoniae TaxID=941986 RepID=A0A8H9IW63_9PSEU|nr:Na+/H+ antiporter [Amycolatopsis bartoniae]MBB2933034.1 CPA1 family monovalent cation:H+ antiporter [Amycolatopsis bartoniae]TVT03405.1 Na+/H+ antiporter [Amycolatopsis bartoniae]GHF56549.1 cation:proton antiporter [Amycolatopsis bartoniae]